MLHAYDNLSRLNRMELRVFFRVKFINVVGVVVSASSSEQQWPYWQHQTLDFQSARHTARSAPWCLSAGLGRDRTWTGNCSLASSSLGCWHFQSPGAWVLPWWRDWCSSSSDARWQLLLHRTHSMHVDSITVYVAPALFSHAYSCECCSISSVWVLFCSILLCSVCDIDPTVAFSQFGCSNRSLHSAVRYWTALSLLMWLYCYCPSVLDTVGWVIWPVKIVPNMTYNMFGGTLNPTQLYCTA